MSLLNWLPRSSRRPIRTRAAAPRRRLGAEMLEARTVPAGLLAVGTDAGVPAAVRIFRDADLDGTFETQGAGTNPTVALSPYGTFTGGVRVALGDFDGDGNDELVTAAGPGGAPHVIVWDLNSDGTVGGIRDSFFAFDTAFTGGANIATGDVDGDGKDELVIAADAGGGPHVKVFSDTDGDDLVSDNLTDQFFPYANFTGGVRLALGDVDNNGGEEIVCAPGAGGGPHVRIYTDSNANRAVSDQPLKDEFFAYDQAFTGGVYVAAGRIGGAGNAGAEVIVGAGAGGGPHVKVFTDTTNNGKVSDDPVFDQFFPYAQAFTGGVRVSAGDANNTGTQLEIITSPGPTGGPHVKIYADSGDAGNLLSDNAVQTQFFADATTTVGTFTAFGKVRTGTYSRAGLQSIPDQGTLNSVINVPAGAGVVRDLDVSLNIQHTFINDLSATLTHVPSGRTVALFSRIGDANDGLYVVLDDESGSDIGGAFNGGDKAIAGLFNPEGTASLTTFDGVDASGDWRLTITDGTGNDVGFLLGWSLDFTF